MRKLPATLLASLAAAALAGTAVAASRSSHVMTVPLPDGSAARVEYVGDIVPRITVESARAVPPEGWAPILSFAGFDQIFEQMNRQAEAMMRAANQAARQATSSPPAPFVARFSDGPAGVSSTTIVSYSNGGSSCTRTTQVVSQGPGRRPKVSSTISGNCAPERTSPQSARSLPGLNHT